MRQTSRDATARRFSCAGVPRRVQETFLGPNFKDEGGDRHD
ncbi:MULTISPECIES: hypothetical protein [Micrococcaceae]|nr:hypothetical protein [Arthrobacter sp. OY3WO11]